MISYGPYLMNHKKRNKEFFFGRSKCDDLPENIIIELFYCYISVVIVVFKGVIGLAEYHSAVELPLSMVVLTFYL